MYQKQIANLRQGLKQPLPGREAQLQMAPSFRPAITSDESSVQAGVLLFLYPINSELHIVLIKRPEYPGVHGGQISFPGGKKELADKDLIDTALREANEEVGIPSNETEILGNLTPLYIPVSRIEVFPTVGFYNEKPHFRSDPHEVDALIEVSVLQLLSPSMKEIKHVSSNHKRGEIPYFNIRNNHVWGATAMILNEFLEVLSASIQK